VLGIWADLAADLFSTGINILPANELVYLANNQRWFYYLDQIHAPLPDINASLPSTHEKWRIGNTKYYFEQKRFYHLLRAQEKRAEY
jgi:hypothetical protein